MMYSNFGEWGTEDGSKHNQPLHWNVCDYIYNKYLFIVNLRSRIIQKYMIGMPAEIYLLFTDF
jgi:hypothetical protein